MFMEYLGIVDLSSLCRLPSPVLHLWGYSGDILGILWGCSGDAQGIIRGCSGDAQGILWGYSGDALGMLWGCSEDALGMFWGYSGDAQRMLWGCSGDALGMLRGRSAAQPGQGALQGSSPGCHPPLGAAEVTAEQQEHPGDRESKARAPKTAVLWECTVGGSERGCGV